MTAVWVVRDNGKVEAAFPREDDAVDYRFLYGAADMTVTRETLLTPAHAAVIGTVKQFLDIYNNEKVSDPNAAAWAIGEMESAVATLRDAAEKEDARLKRTEQRHEAERAVIKAAKVMTDYIKQPPRTESYTEWLVARDGLLTAVATLRELEGA